MDNMQIWNEHSKHNKITSYHSSSMDHNYRIGTITSYKNYSSMNKTREKLLICINNEYINDLRTNKYHLKINYKTPEQIAQEITYERYVYLKSEKYTPNDLNRNRREQGSSHNTTSSFHHNSPIKTNPFTKMSDIFNEQISPPNFNRKSLGKRKIIRFSKLFLNNVSLLNNVANSYKQKDKDSSDDSSNESSSLSSLSEESGSGLDEIGTSFEIEDRKDNKIKKQAFNYLQMVVKHIKKNKKNYYYSYNSSKTEITYDFKKYLKDMSPIHRNKK